MTPLSIRKAELSDLPLLLRLYREIDSGSPAETTVQKADEVFCRIRRYPNYAIYIAEQNETIVGTFSLLIMDNIAHSCSPSGVIENVVVDQRMRGKGIGKAMMQFAMESCRCFGCYKMVLSSNIAREEAHRFYEQIGFKRHGLSFVVELGHSRQEYNKDEKYHS